MRWYCSICAWKRPANCHVTYHENAGNRLKTSLELRGRRLDFMRCDWCFWVKSFQRWNKWGYVPLSAHDRSLRHWLGVGYPCLARPLTVVWPFFWHCSGLPWFKSNQALSHLRNADTTPLHRLDSSKSLVCEQLSLVQGSDGSKCYGVWWRYWKLGLLFLI